MSVSPHILDAGVNAAEGVFSPVELADRLAASYIDSVQRDERKNEGQFFTPPSVARLMAKLLRPRRACNVRVLDPGAGTGILSAAVCERLCQVGHCKTIHVDTYETSAALVGRLRTTLEGCQAFLRRHGLHLTYDILQDDFVTTCAHRLGGMLSFQQTSPSRRDYDLVISNPPYGKIQKSDVRAVAAWQVVHGQPNMYALFMAISAKMLRRQGSLIFIVPRSFAAGEYFRRFRSRFFAEMQPRAFHLFGSRREAFREQSVLQENLIVHAQRDGVTREPQQEKVVVTVSQGLRDLGRPTRLTLPLATVLDVNRPGTPLRIPSSKAEEEVVQYLQQWPETLTSLGCQVSTGPVVPFRAEEFQRQQSTRRTVPFLWMQHIRPMSVIWPIRELRKPQFFEFTTQSKKLVLPCSNYVLVRRFSAKEENQRITAAPLIGWETEHQAIALENHLNYIACPNRRLTEDEAVGLAALLNSSVLDAWFRALNGNTQVSATELRSMPMPSFERIREIGARLKRSPAAESTDSAVREVIGIPRNIAKGNGVLDRNDDEA